MNGKHIIITFVLFLLVASASAQQAPAPSDTSIARRYSLGEVQVNASRNNSKLKEMPASISVVSSLTIQETGMKTLSGLNATAPNVFMPDYGSKLTAPIYIRGVGSKINAPSVGLYVDHVPYFEKSAFAFDFFDVEQIEVLRGPQGTLFGRNTMGGIINIVTKSPMTFQGSTLNLSAATYGSYSVNGGHYAKVGDKFAYSLALNYQHNDGFFTNTYSNTLVDNLNSFGGRNRLVWKPARNLTIENIASYERSRQGGYPYALLDAVTGKANPIKYNEYSYYNRDLLSDAVVVTYDAPKFEVLSTTSYQYLNDHQAIDQDFTELSSTYVHQFQKQNMVSQEAIIRSKGNDRVSWLFGVYGFAQLFDTNIDVNYYSLSTQSKTKSKHDIEGGALFHQLIINDFIVRNLSVTAGIRLDVERDALDYNSDKTVNGVNTKIDVLYPALKSLEWLPKAALSYKLGKNNIYAAVSRGYKTGGFNALFDDPNVDLKFKPEHSVNYEVGVKSSLLDNMLYADLALFYIDWTSQQITQTRKSKLGTTLTNLTNAGKSTSKGVEATIKLMPVAGFDATVAYGYTHATFDEYVVSDKLNYNGKYIPFVPKHSLSVQVGKTFRLPSNAVLDKIRVSTLYRGAGDIYWAEKNVSKQSYYGVVDAKISFTRNNLQLDIWSRNLTNTDYQSFYFEMGTKGFVQSGRPMQLGVNLSVNF